MVHIQEARAAAEASLTEKMESHQKRKDEEMEEMLKKIQEHQEKISKVIITYCCQGFNRLGLCSVGDFSKGEREVNRGKGRYFSFKLTTTIRENSVSLCDPKLEFLEF